MNILNLAHSVRQNHALEHATIHVLSRHNPFVQIMGRSTISGFVIFGQLATQEVASAASEALARLQQGEAHLAVHPNCGTNTVVISTLAGLAAFGATLGKPRSKLDRLPLVLIAATLATIVARPLSYRIQEQITTDPEVEDLYIENITRQEWGKMVLHRIVVGRD